MNQRRLMIMRLLDARKKFTARELAERFDVSVRTIQRDLDYLQQLGFPLYTEVGANGGYRVLPNRILPPLQLTEHEAFGLFMMMEYLQQVPDFPYGSIRDQLSDHYFSSLPSDVQDRISEMSQHIAFLQNHAEQPEALTTQIIHAAMEKKQIAFTYASRSGLKEVEAYPIGIYYEHGYWYMPAQKRERVLLYRLDRMQKLSILQDTGTSVPTLKEWLVSTDNREKTEVTVRFTDFGARLAQSDLVFKLVKDHEWRGWVPPEEFPFMARRLLAYGPEAEVVQPKPLREFVRELLESSLAPYRQDF
ncbi:MULTISPECIES: helix-turn-helix transcriptional regulator [unclassified Paenibacillus]|uniref:helix-turn-helix transcriptional regulator n=1 Tax=unclassified Paenibacillus TaxID=185978 RepID=UPI000839BF7B|nr:MULTISPECIES: YafY family protein [unclassified Paenibacillus]NWL87522.1 YafY family transcriptional regulator [Paenibacillus sp. 79R4]